ncbi:protein lingerer isoform X2 [Macrosteles quadrilineatus]|uniref:protein lingerer isoform X2 n=1 Tax=Macrosteles quadrilineatus TaxID=74068 RepID=UPI0023E11B3D|nr:protein lingerer isoform X2 [Macrosteles quadrilineatus]
MSTTARSTPRGGKNNKAEAASTPKTQKTETNKSESPKVANLDKSQVPTAEQMRMAEIMDTKKDDLALKDKIKQVMDATQKSEDEVCTALHDCDNDANKAVNYLLEGSLKDEWSTSVVKKKKNRTASAAKGAEAVNNHTEAEEWETVEPSGGGRGRDRARQRGSGPPRLRGRGSMESQRWRGRENKENERNLEDNFNGERGRRGDRGGRMSNGPGRGGRGGRGGGRLGSRTFQRGERPSGGGFPRSIETWNNPSAEDGSGEKMENWDANGAEDWDTEEPKTKQNENWGDGFPSPEDWDNEEYTGSLADSKVFTPSSGPDPAAPQAAADPDQPEDGSVEQPLQPVLLDTQQPPRPVQMPPSPVGVNTLTPAQSQYLSQLTQQSSDYKAMTQSQPQPQQYPTTYPAPPSVAYSSSYGVNTNSYSSSLQDGTSAPSTQPLPARTKPQKPRVPPPSKIPSSAVEMPPGDAIAVAMLDVQFGAMEFGSDSSTLDTSTSLDSTNTKATVASSAPTPTPTAPTPTSVAASVASIMESYASSQPQQNNLANALGQTQKLGSGDSMLPDVVVTQANSYAAQSSSRPAVSSVLTELTNSTAKSSVDTTLSYNSTDSALYQSQAYQKPATANYPAPTPVSTYNSSNYSTSQVTSSNTGYSSQTGYTNSYGASVTQSTASYPSYTSNQTSYAYTGYPSTNNYQSSGQMYQGSGSTTGYPASYQNSSYPPTATAQQSHKMSSALGSSQAKDSQYESGQVNSNSVPAVSTVSSTPSLGLSATSQSAASTKVTALSTANKSGLVAGIPPQVPPMINTHQYIMGQAAGLPYFQQPMYSYDELMLQQRIAAAAPPMPTGYFDMSFQQQGGAGTSGRDASLGNVAYSMSDGRFARADNASPVPSTLSQNVTTGHQQPMINPSLPPGYAYIYGGFPANYAQFTTPTALYPMAPTAAAANSTSGQYKGPGYGSAAGYGSGYEAGADGYKVGAAGGYSATPQTKAGGTPTTSADLYTKGHATLNKVNSYDKAGFHSGTPPPFNLTGSQTGLAPSGTYAPHLFIPTMPPHQQHHSGATLMHQPLHQDGATNSGPRTQSTSQPNKAGSKQQNYSPSFWATSS